MTHHVQYYAASLFRERKKLTRSAHGYFGSDNIRYYGPNWDSWIKSIIKRRLVTKELEKQRDLEKA